MAVIKKGRPFERNMLIVCEDTNTAPNYLSPLIWLKYPKDNEANFIRIRFTTI